MAPLSSKALEVSIAWYSCTTQKPEQSVGVCVQETDLQRTNTTFLFLRKVPSLEYQNLSLNI